MSRCRASRATGHAETVDGTPWGALGEQRLNRVEGSVAAVEELQRNAITRRETGECANTRRVVGALAALLATRRGFSRAVTSFRVETIVCCTGRRWRAGGTSLMDFLDQAQTTLATEGVKFLVSQAGELVKWWRERRSAKDRALAEGVQVAPQVDEKLVEEVDEHQQILTSAVDRPDGISAEQAEELLNRVRELQELLRTALIVETPPAQATGKQTKLRAVLDVDLVQGKVSGISARRARGDVDVSAEVKTGNVSSSGQVHGIEIDEIGG
ncbi:hypothetical protein [Amycolatopsis pithecellobii]|uniref:Uncharacterized protein n=1 Tax=Amycolatopsis pithecellobii TaxID=664692 RepID=A0A6N7Z5Z5_9PSEU|nr:hypothetical protein [Amycolatopsis pithecellobii]MTD54886.1 hypothetical protein [Amycolatopsis pithecellobii]